MERKNTFDGDGDFIGFEDWVPEELREQIKDFWGQMGRTYKDYVNDYCREVSEVCYHGPNPNGFRIPVMGARIMYFIKDYDAMKRAGRSESLYRRVEGRYIHAWNNMGRVVHGDGTYTVVSSCDMWVRVWDTEEQKEIALS